jgi:hypothetical protein
VFNEVTNPAALEEVAASQSPGAFQSRLDAANEIIRRVITEYIAYIEEYQRQYEAHATRAVELVRSLAEEHES